MNKLSIFAAIAVIIIGVIAIWAASASQLYAPSFGAQIEPSSISVVFVEPVGP